VVQVNIKRVLTPAPPVTRENRVTHAPGLCHMCPQLSHAELTGDCGSARLTLHPDQEVVRSGEYVVSLWSA